MASKTTLNAKNLEALGTERLAALLMEISKGSAVHQRRLRMELAGTQGAANVAREVRKRLVSLARARTMITWHKVKSLNTDLQTQRKTILEVVSQEDPNEAFDLIWQFMALAEPIFERSDDGSGTLIETFHEACADAGTLAQTAAIKPETLADKVFTALRGNGYGQYDNLIRHMAPALGGEGLARLKTHFDDWAKEPEDRPAEKDRQPIGWGMNGPVYEDEIESRHKERTIRAAIEEIADAEGDVDAYIAQQSEAVRRVPAIAAEIATRLLAAQRPAEALQILDAAKPGNSPFPALEWEWARLTALEALGRTEEAQADRWSWFCATLNTDHLRAYLKLLPDFDDLEAEEKAFAHAQTFPDVHRALAFFLIWPALAEAGKLVLARRDEIDGNVYELLTPAADALAPRHPLAATVLLRAMIDFTLERARASRYRYTAAHLAHCATLAPHIPDAAGLEPHDAYVARLKREHGKKQGFWSLVA